MFGNTTRFAVQNADENPIDINLSFRNIESLTDPPIEITVTIDTPGTSRHFDMATIVGLPDVFNGATTLTAVGSGTSTPADITATALELQTADVGAKGYEGVSEDATTVYMATALCNVFGGKSTYYAVQNTSATADASVNVSYSNGSADSATIAPGAKYSFNTCSADNMAAGFSGAATITSSGGRIVAIGKAAGGGLSTAFLGETSGSNILALPYVRWSETGYESGVRQRTFIAVQNIGGSRVSEVVVAYLNNQGEVVGEHILSAIEAGDKQNSNASLATPTSGHTESELDEFGNPEANPNNGFGGAVRIEAPSGSELIALVRIATKVGDTVVAEDYNGIPLGKAASELWVPLAASTD